MSRTSLPSDISFKANAYDYGDLLQNCTENEKNYSVSETPPMIFGFNFTLSIMPNAY